MDFLNQAFAQLRDLFLSMTPAARITAALLLGVIVVSLGFLVQNHTGNPDEYLFGGKPLHPNDADAVASAISQAGLDGFERVGNQILVPSPQKAIYLAAVADANALPRNFHSLLEDALDISPFTDKETRRQRLKTGREQQLSMIVQGMDGVEDANVIFDVQEERFSKKGKATATVSVQPMPGEELGPRRIKNIRNAVAGGIVELSPEDVVVTDLSGGTSAGSVGGVSPESFDDPYFQKRLAFERYMQGKIEQLLYEIPGIRVQVTAELDEILDKTTKTTSADEEPKAVRERKTEESNTLTENEQGGRPGVSAQGPTRQNNQETQTVVKNEQTNAVEESENFIPLKEEVERWAGLIPKQVRVSIAYPTDYLVDLWREDLRERGEDPNQPLPETSTTTLDPYRTSIRTKVEELVVPLLPRELGDNKFSDVKIEDFNTLTPEAIAPPSSAERAFSWASANFNTLTMTGLALVSLVMLRSMVKNLPSGDPPADEGVPILSLEMGEAEDEYSPSPTDQDHELDESRPRLRLNKGPTLKDDLTEIVREDPDAAAAILRTWIGNTG